MTADLAAYIALGLTAIPAFVFLRNLSQFTPPPPPESSAKSPTVSILIPARNEQENIQAALEAALASKNVDLEIIVMDDASTDRTPHIVQTLAASDPRIQLVSAPPLPDDWLGKVHACHQLSLKAKGDFLLFVDADVRLAPDAASRLVAFADRSGADLVSGFPREITGTLGEKLLIPLMHFVLLGFLSFRRMRKSRHPAYSAACGQILLARSKPYRALGGHGSIKGAIHDAMELARSFRRAGSHTDLADLTPVATCRMYQNLPDTLSGLAKNATEGLGSPALILPSTALLFGGQILPFLLLTLLPFVTFSPTATFATAAAVLLAYLPRLIGITRFRQSKLGALLHPVGISLLLGIQWFAFARKYLFKKNPSWKGRECPV